MGKVIMSGIVPQLVAPVTGTPLGDLAVGSIVKLNENGSPVDYIVVNQGIPSNSSLYDSSCDGTWVLRKDIKENMAWHSSATNSYSSSTIHTYLNSTFLGMFDSDVQNGIVQEKIPYCRGGGSSTIYSGASGLSTKIFLLSCYEIGWTTSTNSYFPVDGGCLEYFKNASATDRIAYYNNSAISWWLRSPNTAYTNSSVHVRTDGTEDRYICTNSDGIRPAFILPSDVRVQDDGTIKV